MVLYCDSEVESALLQISGYQMLGELAAYVK